MKKITVVMAVIVAALFLSMVAIPAMIPIERIKTQLVAHVKKITGRDLVMDGKVTVSILPTLGIQLSKASLSNPSGFRSHELIRIGGIDARIKLWPLLSGKIEVDGFVLRDPIIALEVDETGRGNWVLGESTKTAHTTVDNTPKTSEVREMRLGDVRITGGKITYLNHQGTTETIDDINLLLMLNRLDEPLSAKGGLTWHGQTLALELILSKPRALIEGHVSAAEVRITAQPVQIAFTGEVGSTLVGAIKASSPSLRSLIEWVSTKPVVFAGTGLGPLSVQAKVRTSTSRMDLTTATLSLDTTKATGELSLTTATTAGTRPTLTGRLNLETLDLNPYLTPESIPEPAERSDTPGRTESAKHPDTDWSDNVLDASPLQAIEADLTLNAAALKVHRLEVGRSTLTVALHGGHLTTDLTDMAFYQGHGVGQITLDATQNGTQEELGATAHFSLSGVRAETFLAAFGFNRLEGLANLELQLAGHGGSERSLVSSLSGKGSVTFLNGALRGINLAAIARNITSAFAPDAPPQKTDFSECTGSFSIVDGIVTNPDLTIQSPLLRVTGAGSIDLPKRMVNYRIEPKLVTSLEGQGATKDKEKENSGLAIPMIVDGSWEALRFHPDVDALANGKAANALKNFLKSQNLPKLFGQ